SEVAERGKEIFNSNGKCNQCHDNAGAMVAIAGMTANFNFNTGVEDLPDQPADLIDHLPDGTGGVRHH
ncbi:MAG: hypothetical protein IH962_03140, partial [Chloroflexi bacterium]|nr:hypothetical protein [Chloroflexota bacterium]